VGETLLFIQIVMGLIQFRSDLFNNIGTIQLPFPLA